MSSGFTLDLNPDVGGLDYTLDMKINDFGAYLANCRKKRKPEPLRSDIFAIDTKLGTTEWYVSLHTRCYNQVLPHLTLTLHMKKDYRCNKASIEGQASVWIKNSRGYRISDNKDCDFYGIVTYESNISSFILDSTNVKQEFSKFAVLPHYLPTLHLQLIIFFDGENSIVNNKAAVNCKLAEDMNSIMELDKFADCTLKVGSQNYKCHRVILAARSKVFRAMFEHDLKENEQGEVEIKDLDAVTVQTMLDYIYSGETKNIKENARMLLEAAEKYDLQELKYMCEKCLSEDISVENCITLLNLAEFYGANELKKHLLHFVADNARSLLHETYWMDDVCPEIIANMLEAVVNGPSYKGK